MNNVAKGLTVACCAECGAYYYPRRLICRRCGSDAFDDHLIREAIVEESTTILHVTHQQDWTPCHLATVRTVEGLHVIVGLDAPVADGTRVILDDRNGAVIATRDDAGQ